MTQLTEAKAAFEAARTAYAHALAVGDFQACIEAKKLQAKRLSELGRIVKKGMSANY